MSTGSARRESTFMQAKDWALAMTSLNREDVKAVRDGRLDAPGAQKMPRDADQVAALLEIHRIFRPRGIAPGRGSARLHLDECQHIAVVSDEIELALQVWRSEILRDDRVTVPPQIPVSVSLAANAGRASLSLARELRSIRRRIRSRRFRETLAGREVNASEHQASDHGDSLNDFEIPLHRLPADHERKIVLPKFTEPACVVYKKLKSERAPNRQQLHVHAPLAILRRSVVVVFRRLFAEEPKRKARKMPAMR